MIIFLPNTNALLYYTMSRTSKLHVRYRGGVVQTIIGRHFDSVAFPMMTVTVVYKGSVYDQAKSVSATFVVTTW